MDYKEKVIALLNSQELSKEQKEKLENIFPELQESEDDRNIKDLIDELKCSLRAANCQNEACNGGHEKRIALLEWAITWLEKQGEQKSAIDKVETKTLQYYCRTCKHRKRFPLSEYSNKVVQCCDLQPSNRSNSGYKTIKVTNVACGFYEPKKGGQQ